MSPRTDTAPDVSAQTHAATALPVIEIFHSIQGEGTRSGEPATFIRLAGCNLRCTWCDTSYSWDSAGMRGAQRTSVEDLAQSVRETSVVITGGEPMLYRDRLPELIAALRAHGVRHITIETNATHAPGPLAELVDLWSLSPKLSAGSGETHDPALVEQYLARATNEVQLKYVIAAGAADWDEMWAQLCSVDGTVPNVPIMVQPDGLRVDYDVALGELVDLVQADGTHVRVRGVESAASRRSLVRVSAQLHRVTWGQGRRGV